MAAGTRDREEILKTLSDTVSDAAAFFLDAEDALCNGYQTAREVLSHLVFWHREYVAIARALASGCRPRLKSGTFAELNAAATKAFQHESLPELAEQLLTLQETLEAILRDLPDWQMNFPIKHGGRNSSVSERVTGIEAHVRNHVNRLRRALRHGEAWVKAYYPGAYDEEHSERTVDQRRHL